VRGPQPARTPAKAPPTETKPNKPEPKKSVDAPDVAGYAFLDHETALKRMQEAEAAAKPEAQAPPGGKKKGFEADDNPYGVTTLDLTPRCPHCAKEVEEGDIICINCGYNSETRTFGRTRKLRHVTGGDRFLWLLPGIGAILLAGIFIGIACWFDYVVEQGDWEESGPRGFMIWVSIPCGLVAFFALRFAFKRLVLHPSPPEQEIG
jgi:hypothetical protein